jgi:hypothetical protein
MATTYDLIASQTLGSAAAAITFSSIPSTYTDLRLVFTGTASIAADFLYQFNNDGTTIYSQTFINGDGSTASAGTGATLSRIDVNYAFGALSLTVPKMFTLDIFSYAGSTYKTALYTWIGDENGGVKTAVVAGISLYRSTSAINAIKLFPASSANLLSGSTASLYGIKAA